MPQTYSHLLVHLVFGTKERHPWITAEVQTELHPYLGGIAKNIDAAALATGGVADHVHLLIRYPPRLAVSEIARTLKSNSSKWIHERWPGMLFQWQDGYAAFSVSESNRDKVIAYINNQQEHHRTRPYSEELAELLERHGVPYDLRFLGD